ncbi:SRPBCC domain-containing protein [Microbacterium sp. 10M-3C3]|jgi:uncharacterized protein YndB with AHSA1/START domain|uniref:SRPBCC domain-containing protein n=1 Tax=Microbacterium sp. 10M-3C3 TaxID=2483401 RepID=UPI000F641818|nr:SRPBCC domain-containing protein [Microbacterium sp. 10M-3C3]
MSLDSPEIVKDGDRYRMVYDEVYATDAADLWAAVTTRERLARWMADYTGELRLGGAWEVSSEGEAWGRGRITACEPGRSFTTTWHATGEEPTILHVRLEPVEGGTRLVLEHDGVQSLFYGPGWQTYLERLVAVTADPDADLGGEDAWQRRFAELKPAYSARFAGA